ncbi:MAG: hypothetical protein COU51_00720 [Parcubacteria group bacterium CG10_big_fil_rev_8_21_14_0_10_36_14]|nr:MAG: hypothetical protein COU51_00720 [Parcubacteria group bacterium CG10_big_fil_rev_8_21_14_0_10_36_14]
MRDLKYEILKVLSFYDIFEFPLTICEIKKSIGIRKNLEEIYCALELLEQENKIKKEDGYYFLPQNLDGAKKRKARFLVSLKKIERAKRVAKIFSKFPFIRFIGVCNSLGYMNAEDKSDIDFFIIAESGRLWTTRFLTTSFLKIFNMRPKNGNNKDRICLSFFISKDFLDISKIALSDGDPYLFHWMLWVTPLYNNGVYQKFLKENLWVKKYFPAFSGQDTEFSKILKNLAQQVLEAPFRFFPEKMIKKFQLKVMPDEMKKALERKDNSVIINDNMLKFHLLDRREEYREKFYKKVLDIKDYGK